MKEILKNLNDMYDESTVKIFNDFLEKLKSVNLNTFKKISKTAWLMVQVVLPIKLDINTIISTFLYPFIKFDEDYFNVIEDNKEAKNLVESVLKLENIDYTDDKSEAENIRAMFVAIAKDIRVIIIKLAQVYVVAQNINGYQQDYIEKLYFEIKEIYSPLAARLGLSFIKNKLNDLCLAYYNNSEYKALEKILENDVALRQKTINKVKSELINMLNSFNIKGEVSGRIKTISSIYNKLKDKQLSLNQIYDIVALRVMVNSVNDCYTVLGAIHTRYVPLEGRFKDYIAKPKANGYQSLHTTVYVDEMPLEIQIRTFDMHNHAEYGIAAHWLYKEKKGKINSLDDKLIWIRKLIENSENVSASEMLDELKTDVYADDIFVQTPQGKIIQLVENSTPIDFAYMIHSEVGNKCVGAKVNGKMVPLTYKLNNGDIIEIITSSNSKGPSRDWLKYCKTNQAKSKINSFFKKEMKEENIKKGKAIIEQAIKIKGLPVHEILKDNYLCEVYEKYSLKNLDEIYAAVGYGSLTSSQIINRLFTKYKMEHQDEVVNNVFVNSNKNESAVDIEGLNGIMIRFAKCCNPIPGDEIRGFVSRGNGVTIHRKNCASLNHYEQDRLMNLKWGKQEPDHSYIASLKILISNSAGVLAEITNKISDNKINIAYINSERVKDNNAIINVGLHVKNRDQLIEIKNKIKSMNNVLEVERGE